MSAVHRRRSLCGRYVIRYSVAFLLSCSVSTGVYDVFGRYTFSSCDEQDMQNNCAAQLARSVLHN